MKVQEQVCSVDLSRRLKELGVKRNSIFCWHERERVGKSKHFTIYYSGMNNPVDGSDLPAFTVAELGEILKVVNLVNGLKCYYTFWTGEEWAAWESEYGIYIDGNDIVANTEADARAMMIIHLIEQKQIKVTN